ncbi:hypothetical protein KCU85_g268, partial [Aureobasidium melanogenum]
MAYQVLASIRIGGSSREARVSRVRDAIGKPGVRRCLPNASLQRRPVISRDIVLQILKQNLQRESSYLTSGASMMQQAG